MSKGFFRIKEAYDIKTGGGEEREEIWRKVWNMNSCPKTTTFSWLELKRRILIGDNLKKRGMQNPSQCPLCLSEEESMNHLLDECPFSSSLWDWGAVILHRSDRVRGHPIQTLEEWNLKAFKTSILDMI